MGLRTIVLATPFVYVCRVPYFVRYRDRGVLIVRGEEVSSCADRIRLTMRGIGLKNKDGLFGKSDPFFVMLRMREDELWQKAGAPTDVYRRFSLWEGGYRIERFTTSILGCFWFLVFLIRELALYRTLFMVLSLIP